MTNKERVIKGLEVHTDAYSFCRDCPYQEQRRCQYLLMDDALELLKEQEAVKPIRLENWWKCPSCSGNIVANMNYCPRCGRIVKWND